MKLLDEYKARVKHFLKEALVKLYKVENKEGLARLGQEQKIFITVEKIDLSLEELTMKFLKDNEDSLNLVNEVEGITGLLYNVIA